MRNRVWPALIFFSLASIAGAQTSHHAAAAHAARASETASQFGRNLLTNGNAENKGATEEDVAGWARVNGLTGAEYGSEASEWDWGLSGCTGCGSRYLRLAFEGDVHELSTSQTVNVASSADEIDKGGVTASINAELGGFHNSNTTGQVLASFQDASGKELGSIETKPYDTATLPKAERGDTGLVLCQASGKVPAGTRKIVYTWKATRTDNTGDDHLSLGDNFSLTLANEKS